MLAQRESDRTPPSTRRAAALAGLLLASLGATPVLRADVIHVRANAAGANTGASWTDAFVSLQDALAAAEPGDELWVAAGVYTPSSTMDRAASFFLASGVALYGGFAGRETALDQRDVAANETILSGDLAGDDGPPGSFLNNEENSFHVVVALNVDDTAILDGFTITAARADGPGYGAVPESQDQGSGLNVYDATPQIRNCTFRGNWSINHGAINDHGSSLVLNCTFVGNYSASFGAGLYIHHHSETLAIGCTFADNVSVKEGAGAYSRSMHGAMLMDCLFIGNTAERGAGMYHASDSATHLMNCVFVDNLASFGAGLYVDHAAPRVEACTFTDNVADVGGAGIYNSAAYSTIHACYFAFNESDFNGGVGGGGVGGTGGAGVWNDGGAPVVAHCTFEENLASFGAGIYNGGSSTPLVHDCTLINNTANEGAGIYSLISNAAIRDCTLRGNLVAGGAFPVGGAISNYFSNAIVSGCVIENNAAELGGGGIYNEGESPVIVNCVLRANQALGPTEGWGGGMLNSFLTLATVANCVFDGNTAHLGGGAYNLFLSAPNMVNCTFVANAAVHPSAPLGGGLYVDDATDSLLQNCILFANLPDQLGGQPPAVTFSCVQGGYVGDGNVDADPLFVDSDGPDDRPGNADDDLRLQPVSPCRDTGDAAALPPDAADLDADADTAEPLPRDLDRRTRVDGAAPDMGAYEWTLPGDLDCSGVADARDLPPFVLALLDPAAYAGAYPKCPVTRADLNGDGWVDGEDLPLFVATLLAP